MYVNRVVMVARLSDAPLFGQDRTCVLGVQLDDGLYKVVVDDEMLVRREIANLKAGCVVAFEGRLGLERHGDGGDELVVRIDSGRGSDLRVVRTSEGVDLDTDGYVRPSGTAAPGTTAEPERTAASAPAPVREAAHVETPAPVTTAPTQPPVQTQRPVQSQPPVQAAAPEQPAPAAYVRPPAPGRPTPTTPAPNGSALPTTQSRPNVPGRPIPRQDHAAAPVATSRPSSPGRDLIDDDIPF